MSSTVFTSANDQSVKIWSRQAYFDAVKATVFGRLRGKSDRSVIQIKDELGKEGDRVRFRLRALPSGIGVGEGQSLEGREEGLEYTKFDLNLGEKGHAFKVDLGLSAQRTMADVRADARSALTEWTTEYLDTTFMEYLTGIGFGPVGSVPATLGTYDSRYHPGAALGGNLLPTYATNRQIRSAGTTPDGITATDTMSLKLFDKAVEQTKLASPTMRKALFEGASCYVMILHPYQVSAMRSNTLQGQWFDIQKAITQGGGSSNMTKEGLGAYRDVMVIEDTRVPLYLNASGVLCARGVLLGAQAAAVATGRMTDADGQMKVVEQTKNYGKELGVGAWMVWGLQRTKFDNQSDFAAFSIDTAAAPIS